MKPTEHEQGEHLLRQALAAPAEPDEQLNEQIMERYKNRHEGGRTSSRKRMSVGVLVAIFTLLMSATALAAAQLFHPKQVVEHMGEHILAKAFDSRDAIAVNETAESGDYRFTLHGRRDVPSY